MNAERPPDAPARDPAPAATLPRAPAALSCVLGAHIASPLQWITYLASSGTEPLIAWLFAPAVLFPPGRRDEAALDAISRTPVYAALADKASEAILVLHRNEKGSEHLSPIVGAARSETGLLWMATTRPTSLACFAKMDAPRMPARVRGLASALQSLHELGILHLDVHPDLIGFEDETAMLRGFGIDVRRALPADAESNRALGRLGFSAPELWDASGRSALGPWTDVYGAAATCFYWVTGEAPADFRSRLESQAASKHKLAKLLREGLGSNEPWHERFIDAIVAGLSPRIEDRPLDMACWLAAAMPSARDAREAEAQTSEPPSADRRAAREEEEGKTARPGGSDAGHAGPARLSPRRVLTGLVLAAAGAALVTAFWQLGPADRARDNQPQAPSSSASASRPALPPTAPPAKTTAPVPMQFLAGVAFQDDPERLDTILRTLWGSLPSSHSSDLYFRDFRANGSCAQPVRLHLRADGEGLLVVRPTGLIWVTEWNRARSTAGTLVVSITQIQGEAGPIDVPGLIGSARTIEVSADALHVTYVGSEDAGGRDSYEACEERATPS